MKNILIVTYYFDPYNIVATRRPVSWANYLSDFYNITVVTRSWTGQENGIKDVVIENTERSSKKIKENLEVFYLPYVRPEVRKFKPKNWLLKKMNAYYRHFFGKFSEIEFIEENFEPQILEIVRNKKIDLVIYTCNPYLFLNISKRINKITQVKYIIDFRDLISEDMLLTKPKLKEILFKRIMLFRLKLLVRPASALITVSDPINKILSNIFPKNVYTIYNGFDAKQFSELRSLKENGQIFNITYTGNIYPQQNFDIFLKGAAIFFENLNPNAQVQFIGISHNHKLKIEMFKESIKLNIIDWMPHQQALEFARQSSVLLFFGWKGFSGIVSGKIFDYVGTQRTILLAPSDEDVLEELLIITGAGVTANTSYEVADILENLYYEWEKTGHTAYKGDINRINEFTRENQAQKLVTIINSLI